MPFTLAHPAAVIPFSRTRLVVSALVVGSIAPDFAYFIPGRFNHHIGHTAGGVFIFSLPAGLAALILFQNLLKRPLVSLLPVSYQRRLESLLCPFQYGPLGRFGLILLSLLVGILSHVGWDAFTHKHGLFVRLIPILTEPAFHTPWGLAPWFKVFQHASTVIGLAAIASWLVRWLRRTPETETRWPIKLKPTTKLLVLLFLVASPLSAGVWYSLPRYWPAVLTLRSAEILAFRVLFAGVLVLLLELLLFSAAWQAAAVRAGRQISDSRDAVI